MPGQYKFNYEFRIIHFDEVTRSSVIDPYDLIPTLTFLITLSRWVSVNILSNLSLLKHHSYSMLLGLLNQIITAGIPMAWLPKQKTPGKFWAMLALALHNILITHRDGLSIVAVAKE